MKVPRTAFFSLCALGLATSPAQSEHMGAARSTLAEKSVPPPASWQVRRDYSRFPVSLPVVLPALTKAEAAARLDAAKPGAPLPIGLSRELPETYRDDLAKTLQWTALPGGGWVASISVRSPGAEAVRLAVRAALPEGARMRFFEVGNPEGRYPLFKRGDFVAKRGVLDAEPADNAAGMRWSPVISGDTVGVEIEIPPFADLAQVSFWIVRASHIWGSPLMVPSSDSFIRKNAAACDPVEVACKTLPSCPNDAVAQISFTEEDGNTYACTGTAVNSTRSGFDNFDTPFFLTAAHCVGSQNAAESVVAYWRYENQTCGGTELHPNYITSQGGADLVASDPDSDSSLLRLRDALPNSACLAAWDARSDWAQGTDVVSLHHPGGGVKEWVGGRIEMVGLVLLTDEDIHVDAINVVWSEGSTRPGSSGAGLFATDDEAEQSLIGLLAGGSDCSQDSFGRFDRFFVNHAGGHLLPTETPVPDDHGGAAENATGVLTGSETPGQIDDGSDTDVFRVAILERGTLTVYTTGALDTVGRLKTGDGSTIDFNDDGGQGQNFRIEAELAPGTYYVKVTGYDPTETGSYRLHVEFVAAGAAKKVLVPLFLSASADESLGRQGFVRVFNRSDRSGEVRIRATDDGGESPDAVTLSIGSGETRHFNSLDLERGNAQKGLSGSTGPGTGDWRLEFDSDLDIEVAAYVRTQDGFLTAMHDLAILEDRTGAYHVPTFNPASNTDQRSRLRLINPDLDNAVDVTINGYDDDGADSAVSLRLLPGMVRTLDALELEGGGDELEGRLGDGAGKWRLFIKASGEIHVVNLLDSVTGDLTNLSSPGGNNYR